MNIGEIMRQSWDITRRYRVLWIFGLLAALGSGGGGSSRFDADTLPPEWNEAVSDLASHPMFVPGVVVLVIVVMALGLALALLAALGEGALIDAVTGLRAGIAPTWHAGLASGTRHALKIWLIRLLLGLPILLVVLTALLPALISLLGRPGAGQPAWLRELASMFSGQWLICLVPLFCLLIPFSIALNLVGLLAVRAGVVEDRGVWASIVCGWQLLWAQFGRIIGFGLAMVGVLLAISLVIMIPMCVILMLIVVPTMERSGPAAFFSVWTCGGLLFVWLVGMAFNSVLQVFTSSCWTLAYGELRGERAAFTLV